MEMPDRREAKSWEGHSVHDTSGELLGECIAVFADTDTGVTEWLQLGGPGRGRSFVPAADATESGGVVTVRFSAGAVRGAPRVGGTAELSKADERRLYAHYGVPVSSDDTASLLPADAEPASSTKPATAPATPAKTSRIRATKAPAGTTASGIRDAATKPTPEAAPVKTTTPAPKPVDAVRTGPTRAAAAAEPVTPAPAAPSIVPTPAAPPASTGGGAAVPVGGVAVVGLGVALAARALQQRSRRRNRPAAKASRFAGALPARAASTASARRAQLLAAGSASAELAAQRRKAAAKAAVKRKKAASKATAGTVQSTRKAAATKVKATRRTTEAATSGLAAAPRRAGRKVRKAERGVARNLWQALVAATGAGAYVLGARAGEERYAQLEQQASQLAAQPQVHKAVASVKERVGASG